LFSKALLGLVVVVELGAELERDSRTSVIRVEAAGELLRSQTEGKGLAGHVDGRVARDAVAPEAGQAEHLPRAHAAL
jgi:hypothetical protein